MNTFFFSQCECDWFMIPTEMRAKWEEMTANDFGDDQDACDAFEELFGEYRTGGDISHIEFTPTNQ